MAVKKKTASRGRKVNLPKTPGGCADALYRLDQEIGEQNRVVKQLQEKKSELRTQAEKVFGRSKLKGAIGKVGKIEFKTKQKVNIEDFDALLVYANKSKQFDLIQRRANDKAVRDRLEDGKKVPGVKVESYTYMSITKK